MKKSKSLWIRNSYSATATLALLLSVSSCNGIISEKNSTSLSSDEPSSSALTTYQEEQGDRLLILNGVTENNKKTLAEEVFSNLNPNDRTKPIKFTDSEFVDADKYCYLKQGYDSTLCWSASSSNILRISGWADDFENPLVSEKHTHLEDDIFSFFTANFTDAGNLSEYALSYYFDGLLGATTSGGSTLLQEKTDIKPSLGSSFAGYLPKLCSQAMAHSVLLTDQPDYVSQMENLDKQAMEISITKMNPNTKESIADSAHSMTLVGALIDKTKSGKERYEALLIADSDNESSAEDFPTSFEEANEVKRNKTNSYTLYFTDTSGNLPFGFYYGQDYAQITDLTVLPFKSDEVIKQYTETCDYATCDKSKNGDLVTTFLTVYSDDYDASKFTLGKTLSMNFFYVNRSDSVSLTKENTGKDILENEIDVYRDGSFVGSIKDGLSYDLSKEFGPRQREIVSVNLSDSGLFSTEGKYTVKVKLNTNGCKEAYTLNNESDSFEFEITKS